MEFEHPPTTLTAEEQAACEAFEKRLDFVRDLNDASNFLKWQWMHTEVSPVPVEIKYHILEDDPIKALAEFEVRSAHLEAHDNTDGCRFNLFGRKHKDTVQHSAELTFGNGMVRYVVMWIERIEVTEPEYDPKTAQHQLLVTGSNYLMYGKCYCGERLGSVSQGIDGQGLFEELFADHLKAVNGNA